MKNKTYFLNTILTVELGIFMMVAVIVRAFLPVFILPKLEIPNLVLVSLIALLINHYFAKDKKPCYLCVAGLSAVSFGVLPLVAGYVSDTEVFKCALAGALVFTLVTWLFTSMQERLSTGPAKKAAPILSALCLYLASQGMIGML